MKTFHVVWSVSELINGPGRHDDGVRDGDVSTVASGEVTKEAESVEAIRAELTEALERGLPRHALGPTYNIERTYNIEITDVTEFGG